MHYSTITFVSLSLLSALTTAAPQSDSNSILNRKTVWLSNPTKCYNEANCNPCGASGNGCPSNTECGTWAGEKMVCCKVVSGAKDETCSSFGDVLVDLTYTSGTPTKVTDNRQYCDPMTETFVISDQEDLSKTHCCPNTQDALLRVTYPDTLNDIKIEHARCIPALSGGTEAPGDDDNTNPTTSGGSSTSTPTGGSTTSQTPNAANAVRAGFALAPVAVMGLLAF